MTVYLSDIATRARARTDTSNSNAPPDTDVYSFVNQALKDLTRIINEVSDGLGLTYQDVTIATGNTMPLPVDIYGLKGVDRDPLSSTPQTVHPFNFAERNRVGVLQYMIKDGDRTLYILPVQRAPGNYRIWYVPVPAQLDVTNPATSALPLTLEPFDGYLTVKTAIYILDALQDPETGRLDNDLAEQETLVRDAFARRDSEVKQAPDVRGRGDDYTYLGGDPLFWS